MGFKLGFHTSILFLSLGAFANSGTGDFKKSLECDLKGETISKTLDYLECSTASGSGYCAFRTSALFGAALSTGGSAALLLDEKLKTRSHARNHLAPKNLADNIEQKIKSYLKHVDQIPTISKVPSAHLAAMNELKDIDKKIKSHNNKIMQLSFGSLDPNPEVSLAKNSAPKKLPFDEIQKLVSEKDALSSKRREIQNKVKRLSDKASMKKALGKPIVSKTSALKKLVANPSKLKALTKELAEKSIIKVQLGEGFKDLKLPSELRKVFTKDEIRKMAQKNLANPHFRLVPAKGARAQKLKNIKEKRFQEEQKNLKKGTKVITAGWMGFAGSVYTATEISKLLVPSAGCSGYSDKFWDEFVGSSDCSGKAGGEYSLTDKRLNFLNKPVKQRQAILDSDPSICRYYQEFVKFHQPKPHIKSLTCHGKKKAVVELEHPYTSVSDINYGPSKMTPQTIEFEWVDGEENIYPRKITAHWNGLMKSWKYFQPDTGEPRGQVNNPPNRGGVVAPGKKLFDSLSAYDSEVIACCGPMNKGDTVKCTEKFNKTHRKKNKTLHEHAI